MIKSWLMLAMLIFACAEQKSPRDETLRVFTIDPAILENAKAKIVAADPWALQQLDSLLVRAEAALQAEPVSVMDKKLLPPSGDKHDYLTRAPYFWPNPDTPDGLPWIKRDGHVNPESRTETDTPAQRVLTQSVRSLSLAYYLTGEEKYAEHAAKMLRTWFIDPATKMNPHLNFAQQVPGVWEGTNWGIIGTWQYPWLVDAVGMIAASPAWTQNDQQGMVAWFDAYLEWLRTSELGIEEDWYYNNHGTFYDMQVCSYALFVGKTELARQVAEASKERRIIRQIRKDGRQPYEIDRTRPFAYSCFNLRGFFDLAEAAEKVGVDLWHFTGEDGRGLHKAMDYIAHYAENPQKWYFPDLDFDAARSRDLLLRAAREYNDPRYREIARHLPADQSDQDVLNLFLE